MFCENGYNRKTLQKITTLTRQQVVSATILIQWIPKIGSKIKKIWKIEFRATFQMGTNLKNISCKSKDKIIPNSYPGVYELKSSCGSVQNCETKKKINSRSIKHQQDSIKGNWSSSGATEHAKECHGRLD